MHLRKVPLVQRPYIASDLTDRADDNLAESSSAAAARSSGIDPDAFALLHAMQDVVLTDRELTDKAAKAFVSAVRAYSKHEASYIFQLKNLDLFGMGRSYGLLRMPRMPEVSEWRARVKKRQEKLEKNRERAVEGGQEEVGEDAVELEPLGDGLPWEDRDLDWDAYAYTSKPREAERLTALAKAVELAPEEAAKRAESLAAREERKKGQEAWSKNKERKDKRDVRKEKRMKKRDWEAKQREEQLAEAKRRKVEGGGGGKAGDGAEVADGGEEDAADEYKAMLKEAEEERHAGDAAGIAVGGFDDLD